MTWSRSSADGYEPHPRNQTELVALFDSLQSGQENRSAFFLVTTELGNAWVERYLQIVREL
ncbi:MAG: hypothetical protein QGF59_24480 [Pirellulaceae bacterium]|jgi:hypothetical protein|nr:hypothetical protein [Pirellulaceae bacterium]